MKISAITPAVNYVGVNDREKHLFEGLWPLPHGVSYNSYLVSGTEKRALIDGVEIGEVSALISHIDTLLTGDNDGGLDYMVVNHMEPDHSGAIPALLNRYPAMKIVGNKLTIEMIKGFYHIDRDEVFLCVGNGDTLDLGGVTLQFVLTPMVHWPETMVTYCVEEKVLFSCDAFGCFGALNGGVVDSQIDTATHFEEMYRYYGDIVAKYGKFVQAALAKLKGVEIDYICPSHGPVWHDEIAKVVDIYDRMSRFESEEGAVVVYGTMYGNTAHQAEYIASRLVERGVRNVRLHRATMENLSEIIADCYRFKRIIIGCPTYSLELFPPIEALMRALKVREIKNKVMCAFTSYAWTPQLALRRMREYAEEMGIPLAATAEMKHDNFESVRATLDEMVEKSME
jgi:flavorubredoxin